MKTVYKGEKWLKTDLQYVKFLKKLLSVHDVFIVEDFTCIYMYDVLIWYIIFFDIQSTYLQKDVLEAKLTPWHILHSVLGGEGCVQWYIKES